MEIMMTVIKGLGPKKISDYDAELNAMSKEELIVAFKKLHEQNKQFLEELVELRKKDFMTGWLDSKGNPTYQNGA